MRVLIVNPGMHLYGGAELLMVKLANYLSRKGIKNCLLTTSVPPEIEKDLEGTEIIIQRKMVGIFIPIFIFNKVPMLNEIVEAVALRKGIHNHLNRFDVINVHNYPAELSVFPFRKPIVWMCNEPPEVEMRLKLEASPFLKFAKRMTLRFDKLIVRHYIKTVVVADAFNAKRFERIYGFKPEIINYGIDYSFFSQANGREASEKFNLQGNFIALQVGMLTPLKNQIESIKAIEKLKNKIPNIKLVLVGWGEKEYTQMLKRYIEERGLKQNVIFTGHLSREQVRGLYGACDVLLHPIRSQGGWLTPFEALCAKKPVIVSPEMTASEIIDREKIGIVTWDLAGAVMNVYNSPKKYHNIAEKGGKWVKENLSWDKFCQRMLNLFYKVQRGE